MTIPGPMLGPFFAPERCATDRFVIRRYAPGDGAKHHEAVDSSFEHLKRFLPWAQSRTTAAESESLVRGLCAAYLNNENFSLGIFSPDQDRLLGGTGFHPGSMNISQRTAEIGMWIRQSEAGSGLGTHALRQMLAWGFSDWPWLRLAWQTSNANTPSQRVACKVGMPREAVLRHERYDPDGSRRDTFVYALTRDEWEARTRS
jgi:ribosomal-protein-serine acetyltransferase